MTAPRPLSLHVPEPGCRPGDTPDFSEFEIPRAGAVRRPDVDEAPENMRDMAFSVVRVLNKAGEAVGPWSGLLDADARWLARVRWEAQQGEVVEREVEAERRDGKAHGRVYYRE